MTEQHVLVDENDNPIGQASKSEIVEKNLLHRGADILISNSQGKIFVHQRTLTKKLYPGYYDAFVGGGMVPGETYEETAKRELEEETGIKDVPLKFLFKIRHTDPKNDVFTSVFKCVYDGPIKIEEDEIIHGKFMSIEKIKEIMTKEKFTPGALNLFKKYLEEYHDN
jgi:isopentenyldiphosphate isomerase